MFSSRLSHNQMHFLYQQLVICSCDTDDNVKSLYFCFREVLGAGFNRTNNIEHHLQNRFLASEHTVVKMLEKYCYAVSFEKELILTNKFLPIVLNVQIMISIF